MVGYYHTLLWRLLDVPEECIRRDYYGWQRDKLNLLENCSRPGRNTGRLA